PALRRRRLARPSSPPLTRRLNQSSMLSSAGSPSFAPPAKVLDFLFSISAMTPPLPWIFFVARATAWPTSLPCFSPAPAGPGDQRSPASSPEPPHDTPACVLRHPLSCVPS